MAILFKQPVKFILVSYVCAKMDYYLPQTSDPQSPFLPVHTPHVLILYPLNVLLLICRYLSDQRYITALGVLLGVDLQTAAPQSNG